MQQHFARLITVIALLAGITTAAVAQTPTAAIRKGEMAGQTLAVTGKVIDGSTKQPIGYATFVLYTQADGTQVTGTITDENGEFILQSITPGLYYADVDFLGYASQRVDSIRVTPVNVSRTLERSHSATT